MLSAPCEENLGVSIVSESPDQSYSYSSLLELYESREEELGVPILSESSDQRSSYSSILDLYAEGFAEYPILCEPADQPQVPKPTARMEAPLVSKAPVTVPPPANNPVENKGGTFYERMQGMLKSSLAQKLAVIGDGTINQKGEREPLNPTPLKRRNAWPWWNEGTVDGLPNETQDTKFVAAVHGLRAERYCGNDEQVIRPLKIARRTTSLDGLNNVTPVQKPKPAAPPPPPPPPRPPRPIDGTDTYIFGLAHGGIPPPEVSHKPCITIKHGSLMPYEIAHYHPQAIDTHRRPIHFSWADSRSVQQHLLHKAKENPKHWLLLFEKYEMRDYQAIASEKQAGELDAAKTTDMIIRTFRKYEAEKIDKIDDWVDEAVGRMLMEPGTSLGADEHGEIAADERERREGLDGPLCCDFDYLQVYRLGNKADWLLPREDIWGNEAEVVGQVLRVVTTPPSSTDSDAESLVCTPEEAYTPPDSDVRCNTEKPGYFAYQRNMSPGLHRSKEMRRRSVDVSGWMNTHTILQRENDANKEMW